MIFKRKSRTRSDIASLRREFRDSLSKLLQEEEKVLGRHVVLRPALLSSSEDTVGWFGGAPMLPEELDWPSIDGEALIFLAQIDLSKLPESVWKGAGPREGQLAFFIHPKNIKARVLHVKGALTERAGPNPFHSDFVKDIEDSRSSRMSSFIDDQSQFPKWPVVLESGLPSQPIRTSMSTRKGDDPDHPDSYPYGFGLTNRALHPFDGATLSILIDELTKSFSGRLAQIEKFLKEKQLAENTKEALEAIKAETENAETEFKEVLTRLNPFLTNFDCEKVSPILEEIGELPHGQINYVGDDPFGFAIVHVTLGEHSNQYKFKWKGGDYLKAHRKRLRYAYSSDPDSLPKKVRERFETEFEFQAAYEFGAMSHVPDRDFGLAYDPSSGDHIPLLDEPNEVLLELPTSDLVGWMFGDMYSLVYLISRDNLRDGNFNSVFTSVTN